MTGPTGPLVSGIADQTLYYNGSAWTATSNLSNDGTTVSTDADININGIDIGHGIANSPTPSNTIVGTNSLSSNTTGIYNTAIGWHSLESNIAGQKNTAIGSEALNKNTSGHLSLIHI